MPIAPDAQQRVVDVIHIRDGTLHAEIQPAFGGRVIGLFDQRREDRVDWLVPARPAAAVGDKHVKAGCFPMIPYCNRIAGGRFTFEGRDYDVGATHPWDAACHGHGFLRAWDVDEATDDAVTISYEYNSPDWPSRYRAQQRFKLVAHQLEVTLSLENIGESPMPAGFGLHPYFPRRQELVFAIDAHGHWPILPGFLVGEEEPSPFTGSRRYPASTLASGEAYCLSDWRGTAQLRWPKERRHLDIHASPPLSFCVLFAPEGSDAFCLEPSSHIIGAVKIARPRLQTGMRLLQRGKTLSGSVRFACHFDAT